MRGRLRLVRILGVFVAGSLLGTAPAPVERDYVVVYRSVAAGAQARAEIVAAGGALVRENAAVGVATARSAAPGFAAQMALQPAVLGVLGNTPVGHAPRDTVESGALAAAAHQLAARPAQTGVGEPLADLQWDMAQINAPAAHRVTTGNKGVLVGVIDTGIDGAHPDIAPNFNRELSRNFVPDGAAADVDPGGHGTHVAGTIAAPLNGVGIAGVAPDVTLVNLRAGNADGYFFLQPTVDALTYAGDIGVDVVNMSLYIDPWLFNCPNNAADSPAAQREQQTILTATQRALDYARGKGVTLISAAGNESTDLDNPTVDSVSPNFPENTAYDRDIDNTCLTMPTEGQGVISVTALGPTGRKAYYSNYGLEQADLAAPGGDGEDAYGTQRYHTVENLVLAPFPESVLRAENDLNADGSPKPVDVERACVGSTCAYYRWLQGTSMAAPHAVGVAALIISRYGHTDALHGGLAMDPAQVEQLLTVKARDVSCPAGGRFRYPGLPAEYAASCEGPAARNSFFGAGIADAYLAVTVTLRPWPTRLLSEELTPLDNGAEP